MYTLTKFGNVSLPIYLTDYSISPVPAQLQFIQTTSGAFDGAGEGRNRQTFPFSLSYKASVIESVANDNRTKLDSLRSIVGTRAFLYRAVDNNLTEIHYCTARLISMTSDRPYGNRDSRFEIDLNFQQLSAWHGHTNGTGWRLDTGEFLDAGKYFDEQLPTVLVGPSLLFEVTAGGNLPATNAVISVVVGVDPLTKLTIWNMSTNCRFYWAGTATAGATLQIDTGACTVTNNGVDNYNNFGFDETFHRNENWLEFVPGTNEVVVQRVGGGADTSIAFVFDDIWA